MNLTASQKLICERIVNVFETGSVLGDYGNISVYNDGPGRIRQVTYGRSQTTEYGNLHELVEMYVKAGGKYSEALSKYVPSIGATALADDAVFKSLLKKAGREDPVMQQTQDAFFDKRYFQPAMEWATANGFTLPLSALVIYDSFIHSGSILGFLRSRFAEKTPSDGGDEKTWIREYVTVRNNWLATHSMPILRGTVYRTKCFAHEIDRGNWDLTQLPIMANGTPVTDGAVVARQEPDEDVKVLQAWLNSLGADIAVDGYEGGQTLAAIDGLQQEIKAFQREHGLVPDGVVGPLTIEAIKKAPATPQTTFNPFDILAQIFGKVLPVSTTPTTTQGASKPWFSSIFLWLLGNSQIQSLVRTALHAAAIPILLRWGVSGTAAEAIVAPILDELMKYAGAAVGVAGLYYSAQAASPNISNPARVIPTPQA